MKSKSGSGDMISTMASANGRPETFFADNNMKKLLLPGPSLGHARGLLAELGLGLGRLRGLLLGLGPVGLGRLVGAHRRRRDLGLGLRLGRLRAFELLIELDRLELRDLELELRHLQLDVEAAPAGDERREVQGQRGEAGGEDAARGGHERRECTIARPHAPARTRTPRRGAPPRTGDARVRGPASAGAAARRQDRGDREPNLAQGTCPFGHV
ncbi:hypothetical protein [Nannocystis pusilla]|uniref:hypothetical protein n=1 Tax=Nannocystis pusilla TaxID=889268 RepID=UPI003DA368AB